MGKYINPFTDWGFKRLFGQEFSKPLLISFLNDLLVGELHVKDLTFRDKELLPPTKDQRGIICDVYCETDTGDRFIVEMQNRWQPNFLDRSICYACRSILDQVDKGRAEREDAYKFLPVYTICFMNYMPHTDEVSKFRTDIVLADKDTKAQVSNKLRFIYLALPLFEKKAEECVTDFEKWIYVLKHMEAAECRSRHKRRYSSSLRTMPTATALQRRSGRRTRIVSGSCATIWRAWQLQSARHERKDTRRVMRKDTPKV